MWDDELARVAQKWSDQCADVDYKGDYKRQDPLIKHDKHPQRKVGESGSTERENWFMAPLMFLLSHHLNPAID